MTSMATARFLSGAFLVFMALASPLAAQDLTVTTVEDGETETLYVGRAAMRYVTESDDIIIRLEQKKYILVDHAEKTYSELTFDQMRKMAAGVGKDLDPKDKEELSRSLDGGRESTFKRMGPGDTILGYKTEKYLLTGPLGQIEVHAAPSLETPAAYFEAINLNAGGPFAGLTEQFKAIKGMMLKTVSNLKILGSPIVTTSVATRVDRSPIPAARFEPPSGYKNVPPEF